MSIPESTPATTNPYAATTVAAPFDRWRWLLAGVIGILGGYITVSSVNSQLVPALGGVGGMPLEVVLQLAAQGVFGLVVTSFAFFVAPGPLGRRALAVVLFVVIVVVLVVLLAGRMNGSVRLPGPGALMLLNAYWVVLVVGGLGWLLAAGARPVAYLVLLLTFIVMPLGYALTMNNISSGISTSVQLVLSLVVALVILLVSRPAPSPVPAAAVTPSPAASELAPTAFVAMEEGAETGEAPRPSAAP